MHCHYGHCANVATVILSYLFNGQKRMNHYRLCDDHSKRMSNIGLIRAKTIKRG